MIRNHSLYLRFAMTAPLNYLKRLSDSPPKNLRPFRVALIRIAIRRKEAGMTESRAPVFAAFDNVSDALAYRKVMGGWVFAPDDGAAPIWFSFGHTPSQIMTHQATRGHSGALI